MSRIYKILARADWLAAKAVGRFDGSVVDLQDGYIHFSTADQAPETAQRHFVGQADLVVLEVEGDDLGDTLKWERSRSGELFPHLYGPLSATTVLAVFEAPLDPAGVPQLRLVA